MLTVQDIMDRDGVSRSTAYRRLKEEQQEEAESAGIITEDTVEGTLEWCEAVLWAAKHVNTARMSERRAGSKLRYSLWQFGRGNTKELVVNMVPKALTILDKNKQPEEIEAMEEAEKTPIAELEKLLETTLEEALA